MTKKPAIMIQGTGSDTGKSLIAAGLCRLFTRRGMKVRPFKPQNMSNNAAVTKDGGEIGRAQALQARACKIEPLVHMNPVLLKPESETGAQIIVQGKRMTSLKARDYSELKPALLSKVLDSLALLEREADLVIVEGAGSPAEINLRAGDIANMGFAEATEIPVLLIGDIDRGGVIASLVGTYELLPRSERARIKAFAINKFRGDPALFDDGLSHIGGHTGWSAAGVIPWFDDARKLPAEDALGLTSSQRGSAAIEIAVLRLSRIANFDDLDPLAMEADVSVHFVEPGEAVPGSCDLVIIPGTKSTIADLEFIRTQGWDIDLAAHIRRGGHVLGLCGGFQMLGRKIEDPLRIEGKISTLPGLGHLDVKTVLTPDKVTQPVTAKHIGSGSVVKGYEIHLGQTKGADLARPFLEIDGRPEGAMSPDGRIIGSYVHGMFACDPFRTAFLGSLAPRAISTLAYDFEVERVLDKLADHLETHLDCELLLEIAQSRTTSAKTMIKTP